jgi:phosphoglycolate phosphatase
MKLVLFDIDGTLLWRAGTVSIGYPRFAYAVRSVYGVEPNMDMSKNFGGWVDRGIVRQILTGTGIGESEFLEKWPAVADALVAHAQEQTDRGIKQYVPIPDAVSLATMLSARPDIRLGVMTGNVEKMGKWKLHDTGIDGLFPFGVYSDGVDDRIALAKTALPKAEAFFGEPIAPADVIVIGDTVHDVRCGKAIGADTIVVIARQITGGIHGGGRDRQLIEAERPTMFVDSLTDGSVLSYFGIQTAA